MTVILDLLNNDPRARMRPDKPRHPEKAKRPDTPIQSKPAWIRVKAPGSAEWAETKRIVRENKLVTVCEEASCPNIGECWAKKHATFMIMGDTLHARLRFLQRAHWPAGCRSMPMNRSRSPKR